MAISRRLDVWVYPILVGLGFKLVVLILTREVWLGADGENYLQAMEGLERGGLFSDERLLSYWPAGYPLLLWALKLTAFSGVLLGLFQSVLFAASTFVLLLVLRQHITPTLTFLTSAIISLTPTLALTTLTVAYESVVASMVMLAVAAALLPRDEDIRGWAFKCFLVASPWAVMSFLQPRMVLPAVVFVGFLVWRGGVARPLLSLLLIFAILITPAVFLAWRNSEAVGEFAVSTNLGVTMAIGAGDNASGAYSGTPGVSCDTDASLSASETDRQTVKCVLGWYLNNPSKVPGLLLRKTMFYWSPYSGPSSTGTYAVRNPWNKVNPLWRNESLRTDADLIPLGRMWVLGQLALLILGVFYLRRNVEFSSYLLPLIVSPVVLSWLISLGTIGDHRFRIPLLPLSLFLQVAGLYAIARWTFSSRTPTSSRRNPKKERAGGKSRAGDGNRTRAVSLGS
jgi:hypothetical protein